MKKQGFDTDDLIDYYETHHVPLILSLAPAPTTYRRNYLRRDAATNGPDDFDIVAELVFADRATYQDWVSTMYAPGSASPRRNDFQIGPGRDPTSLRST